MTATADDTDGDRDETVMVSVVSEADGICRVLLDAGSCSTVLTPGDASALADDLVEAVDLADEGGRDGR